MNQQLDNPPNSRAINHLEELSKSFKGFLDAANRHPYELVREKPSATAFSATEIIYHMLDVETLWQHRMDGLLNKTMTHFQAMDPDKEATKNKYNEKSYDAGIVLLREAREKTHRLVRTLTDKDLELTGIHSKYGPMNILAILETMKGHDRAHAAQLERTLEAVRTTQTS